MSTTRQRGRMPGLPKAIWTDADFDQLGWHDCAVHALAVEPALPHPGQLPIDLDYIVESVTPTPLSNTFSFWVSPGTLVFDAAWDFAGELDLRGFSFELSLDGLERSGPDEHGAYQWTPAGHQFRFSLHATGFTQYLRRPPVHSTHQRLSVSERGGLGVERQGYTR